MGRTKLPNARTKPIGTQVSQAEYAAVEQARGDVSRSQWIHGLILDAVDNAGIRVEYAGVPAPPKKRGRPAKAPRKRGGYEAGDTAVTDLPPPRVDGAGEGPEAEDRASRIPGCPPPPPPPARALRAHPPGAAVFQDPGAEAIVGDAPPAPAATRKRCNHPGTRLIGGFCPLCDHVIEPGGYWRET